MSSKIGKDLKELLKNKLEGMAESHLEGWQTRYEGYNKSKLSFDLQVNHDSSLEIEYAENELKRKLSDEEYEYLVSKFNKEVVRQFLANKQKGW